MNQECTWVAVELPEKQGLKLEEHKKGQYKKLSGCSGTSRKTRIETSFRLRFVSVLFWLQWNFQKNKD